MPHDKEKLGVCLVGDMVIKRQRGQLVFSAEQLEELLGGKFPDSGTSRGWPSGFAWQECEYHLEEGELVPYGGGSPAPGPNLRLAIAR